MARLKLDLSQLDELFPGQSLSVLGQTVVIRPLGLLKLSMVAKQLDGFGAALTEAGVSWENYNQPSFMLKLAQILLTQFPEVLAEASNIDVESLQALPIEIVAEILNVVLEVNLEAREKLEKNWNSLAEKLKMTQKPASGKKGK